MPGEGIKVRHEYLFRERIGLHVHPDLIDGNRCREHIAIVGIDVSAHGCDFSQVGGEAFHLALPFVAIHKLDHDNFANHEK